MIYQWIMWLNWGTRNLKVLLCTVKKTSDWHYNLIFEKVSQIFTTTCAINIITIIIGLKKNISRQSKMVFKSFYPRWILFPNPKMLAKIYNLSF